MSQPIETVDELKRKIELQRKAVEETHLLIEEMERDAISKRRQKYRPVAELAHELICPYNHTDGCAWGYENDSWSGSEHVRWLGKIEQIIQYGQTSSHYYSGFTLEKLIQLLNLLADMKRVDGRAISILRGLW